MKAAPMIFFSLLLLVIITSCGGGEKSIFHNLPTQGWAYTSPVTFSPVEGDGELFLAVRHDASYPYSNLWLEVSAPLHGGAQMVDTVNLTLCDNYGRWLGKGFGGSYQMEVPVAKSVKLDSGTTVTMRHIMRLDTLHGIDQIGLRLALH